MDPTTVEEFYQQTAAHLPGVLSREIGHFNVFDVEAVAARYRSHPVMPYNRRAYYKVSLVIGRNRAEFADKVILIDRPSLVFATPQIPYHWVPLDDDQRGSFCIFTPDFLGATGNGLVLSSLPLFQPGSSPVFPLGDEALAAVEAVFARMHTEMASDYTHKYELIRHYVWELLHWGQKLQPDTTLYPAYRAADRITSMFLELLERQFPIESPGQTLALRTAAEFADRLAVHTNHLNRALKQVTGQTTTELIAGRVLQEATILLNHTGWNVSEIGNSLGFAELAHFSHFYKNRTGLSPQGFRESPILSPPPR